MASTDVLHNQPLSEQVKGRSVSLLDFMPEIPTQPLSEAQRESMSISELTPEISTPIRSGYVIFMYFFPTGLDWTCLDQHADADGQNV